MKPGAGIVIEQREKPLIMQPCLGLYSSEKLPIVCCSYTKSKEIHMYTVEKLMHNNNLKLGKITVSRARALLTSKSTTKCII